MNNLNLMKDFIRDINDKKDFNEYISEKNKLRHKQFYLFTEAYFNMRLLNTLSMLVKVFEYYQSNIDIDTNNLLKIILLQSVPANKKNKPNKKIIKLNEFKKEKEYWITDPKIRFSVMTLYPATLFNKKWQKHEEIGKQRIRKELSLNTKDEFKLEDLVLNNDNNYYQLKQFNISIMKIKEYIYFRKSISK